MQFKFTSMEQMADFIEANAKKIRAVTPEGPSRKREVMRAEAYAYEQSAMIIRNAVIEADPVATPAIANHEAVA